MENILFEIEVYLFVYKNYILSEKKRYIYHLILGLIFIYTFNYGKLQFTHCLHRTNTKFDKKQDEIPQSISLYIKFEQ